MADVKIPCSTIEYLALTEKQKLQLLKQASSPPPVRCDQHTDTDPHEKDESRAGIPPFESDHDRKGARP
jgi:hypothetical protein